MPKFLRPLDQTAAMTHTSEQMSREDALAKVAELIDGIRIAMFTSVDTQGRLHARPMATQEQDFDGTLWFFTWKSTEKVDEFQHNPHVNVAYSQPNKHKYVSVSGRAQLVTDKDKMRELWSPDLKAWFPQGLDDPQSALIRVDVDSAEYWDSPSGKVVAAIGVAKALITGQSASNVGENKTVEL